MEKARNKKLCSHHENRQKVCLVCLKKEKNLSKLTILLKYRVKKFIPIYNENDERIPLSICGKCEKILYLCEKNNNSENLKLPNYLELKLKKKIQDETIT